MDAEMQAVLRAQDGDTEAFRAIVDLHGPVLYRAAVMMTRNTATAEDAVQDTFLKAWRSIGSFRAGTKLRAWLVRILVNHLNGLRRRKVLDLVRLLPGKSDFPGKGTPESQLVTSETAGELLTLLDTLNRNERAVVVMHYYMELTLSEIAQATGWPAGTVRSRLSRALSRLREHIGQLNAGRDESNSPDIWSAIRSVSRDET